MSVSTGEWIGIGIGAAVLLIVIGYLIYNLSQKRKQQNGIGDKMFANVGSQSANVGSQSANVGSQSASVLWPDEWKIADRNYQAHQDRVLDAVRRRDQNKKGTVNSPKPRKKSKEKKVSKKKAKK